jgi:ketosteroid isomerase-like protein
MQRVAYLLVAFFLCMQPAFAQQGSEADESLVRALIAKEMDGWAKFDARTVASCYSADSIWQNPFGVRLHGDAELERFLKNLFQRPGYRSATDTSAPKIIDIRHEGGDVWVVWSDEASKGQIDDRTGKPMAPRHSYYMEVVVKTPAGFRIKESIIMDSKQE